MLDGYNSDYVVSEDVSTPSLTQTRADDDFRQLEAILEMSRFEYQKDLGVAEAPKESEQPSYLRKHEMNARLSALESEIKGVDEQIEQLKGLRQSLLQEKQEMMRQNKMLSSAQSAGNTAVSGKGKARADRAIDYTIEFDWNHQLKGTMKKVFGITDFRLCQQG